MQHCVLRTALALLLAGTGLSGALAQTTVPGGNPPTQMRAAEPSGMSSMHGMHGTPGMPTLVMTPVMPMPMLLPGVQAALDGLALTPRQQALRIEAETALRAAGAMAQREMADRRIRHRQAMGDPSSRWRDLAARDDAEHDAALRRMRQARDRWILFDESLSAEQRDAVRTALRDLTERGPMMRGAAGPGLPCGMGHHHDMSCRHGTTAGGIENPQGMQCRHGSEHARTPGAGSGHGAGGCSARSCGTGGCGEGGCGAGGCGAGGCGAGGCGAGGCCRSGSAFGHSGAGGCSRMDGAPAQGADMTDRTRAPDATGRMAASPAWGPPSGAPLCPG